jgi:hypothetical protein
MKKRSMYGLGCFIFIFVVVSLYIYQHSLFYCYTKIHIQYINDQLLEMPKDDLLCLEELMDEELFWSPIAYTLFGNKPISISHYFEEDVINIRCHSDAKQNCINENKMKKEGWNLWQKYSYLFPSKNYKVISYKENDDSGFTTVLFINEPSLFNVLYENIYDFQKVLGYEYSNDKIYKSILNGEKELLNKIFNHDALLGMLLGFGRRNAWNFYYREQIRNQLKDKVCESIDFQELDKKLKAFHEENLEKLECFYLPRFCADPSDPETKSLKKKYLSDQQKIRRIYRKNNKLVVTLLQFTKSNEVGKLSKDV